MSGWWWVLAYLAGTAGLAAFLSATGRWYRSSDRQRELDRMIRKQRRRDRRRR